jgi:hypothetical protein
VKDHGDRKPMINKRRSSATVAEQEAREEEKQERGMTQL